MKNIVKYFVLFLFFFVLSCKKDDMPIFDPGTMEHGSLSACRNGDDWLASGEATRHSDDGTLFHISATTYDTVDTPFIKVQESVKIKKIPLQVGKHYLKGKVSDGNMPETPFANMDTYNDDTFEDAYYLDNSKKSWIEITNLDTVNNRIEGTFEIYMVVEKPKQVSYHADKLCFKKGEFAVDLLP